MDQESRRKSVRIADKPAEEFGWTHWRTDRQSARHMLLRHYFWITAALPIIEHRHDQTTDRKWGRHQGSGSASVSYTAWWNKRNKWIIVKEVYLHFEGKHSREEDRKQVWKLEIFFISFQSCGAAKQVFTRRENEIYPRDSMKRGHRINHFKYGWRWSLLMLIKSNPSESISKIIAASAC